MVLRCHSKKCYWFITKRVTRVSRLKTRQCSVSEYIVIQWYCWYSWRKSFRFETNSTCNRELSRSTCEFLQSLTATAADTEPGERVMLSLKRCTERPRETYALCIRSEHLRLRLRENGTGKTAGPSVFI